MGNSQEGPSLFHLCSCFVCSFSRRFLRALVAFCLHFSLSVRWKFTLADYPIFGCGCWLFYCDIDNFFTSKIPVLLLRLFKRDILLPAVHPYLSWKRIKRTLHIDEEFTLKGVTQQNVLLTKWYCAKKASIH